MSSDFKTVPWKNGGGSTLELICIKGPDQDILFRLSMATISQSGPFSIFPQIERHLSLVSGDGIRLISSNKEITLTDLNHPINFSGEEEIHCELLGSTCVDFNVMTNRRYGESTFRTSKISTGENFKSLTHLSYLYLPLAEKLIILNHHDVYTHQEQEQLAYIIEFMNK